MHREYQRKPRKSSEDLITVARYEPGLPLDGLLAVARQADYRAEVAEAVIGPGPVLLVRWERCDGDHPPAANWEHVVPGDYLAYSRDSDFLFDTDDRDLERWYDFVREVP